MTEFESYEEWRAALKPATYILELTASQSIIVQNALEEYVRLRMGQFWDFADDFSKGGYVYDKEDPENSKKFDAWMERREVCRAYLDNMERIVFAGCYRYRGSMNPVSPAAQEAGDIWRVLCCNQSWHEHPEGGFGVNFDKLLQMGPEPLPKCYIKEGTADDERKERKRKNCD